MLKMFELVSRSVIQFSSPQRYGVIPGVYIIESLLISPPAFDFLPRDATRGVVLSMIFFPI